MRGNGEEATHDARHVHVLTSRGRRTGRPGGNASHDRVYHVRTVAARASALHAVGVHRLRVLYCQHVARPFVRTRPIPSHLPADQLRRHMHEVELCDEVYRVGVAPWDVRVATFRPLLPLCIIDHRERLLLHTAASVCPPAVYRCILPAASAHRCHLCYLRGPPAEKILQDCRYAPA